MKTMDEYQDGALPPAPDPAGAPEETGARRCRNCGSVLAELDRQLCLPCREAAEVRHREQKRLYQRARYAEEKTAGYKKKKPGDRARVCGTAGCGGTVSGRGIYCDACRRGRQEAARRKYRISRYVDPLPFGPPTSMDWLKKFDAWAKSGQSYAAFQVRERERHTRRKKRTARVS